VRLTYLTDAGVPLYTKMGMVRQAQHVEIGLTNEALGETSNGEWRMLMNNRRVAQWARLQGYAVGNRGRRL